MYTLLKREQLTGGPRFVGFLKRHHLAILSVSGDPRVATVFDAFAPLCGSFRRVPRRGFRRASPFPGLTRGGRFAAESGAFRSRRGMSHRTTIIFDPSPLKAHLVGRPFESGKSHVQPFSSQSTQAVGYFETAMAQVWLRNKGSGLGPQHVRL